MKSFICWIELANTCSELPTKNCLTKGQRSSYIFVNFEEIFVQQRFNSRITLTSFTMRAFAKSIFFVIIFVPKTILHKDWLVIQIKMKDSVLTVLEKYTIIA